MAKGSPAGGFRTPSRDKDEKRPLLLQELPVTQGSNRHVQATLVAARSC
ncbi:hypothetical protein ACFFX0_32855 [Citricoccus parietis]|uniref:Uncharacterized protein n=1 Tax=Citricoccus parietis TaxID=592307 RepID=A0ABV5G8E8_9MICC